MTWNNKEETLKFRFPMQACFIVHRTVEFSFNQILSTVSHSELFLPNVGLSYLSVCLSVH